MKRWGAYVLVVALGTAATAAAAVLVGAPRHDAVVLAGLAALGATAAAAVGIGLGYAFRARSLSVQVLLCGLTAIAASAAGVLLAAEAMFVSTHDLGALLVVLTAGTAAATVAALLLARRLGRASRRLQDVAVALAADEPAPPTGDLPAELGAVADQLGQIWADLAEARRRERAMEASRRELVAWVSHDLRTPLSGIRAMVEAMADGVVDDPETVARYHRAVLGETERLTFLVDDLFELSRIQAGTLELDLQRVGLADLVSDAIAASGAVADARGVVLEGSLGEPALEVAASVPDLARVLHNLLDNAIRSTPRGGQVRVEAQAVDGLAVLSVRDGCGGIPADEIDRVFDLAFRGDVARTPGGASGGGGGFGLAIARGLVEAHRGAIDVANEADGCCFTIRLPLDP